MGRPIFFALDIIKFFRIILKFGIFWSFFLLPLFSGSYVVITKSSNGNIFLSKFLLSEKCGVLMKMSSFFDDDLRAREQERDKEKRIQAAIIDQSQDIENFVI